MTQRRTAADTNHQLLFHFIFFLYNHPLQLAYMLYFSPFILQLLFFLLPLLFSTSMLLLLLPSPLSLHSVLEDEASRVCLNERMDFSAVAMVGDVFEWEIEPSCEAEEDPDEIHAEGSEKGEHYEKAGLTCDAGEDTAEVYVEDSEKGDLHMNVGLICPVEQDPAEIYSENREKSELSELQGKRMGELSEICGVNCDVTGEDPIDLSLEKYDPRSEISGSKSNESSFVPQTPDRTCEVIVRSRSARRTKQSSVDLRSLRRGRSTSRTSGEFYKHSAVNSEVAEDPNEFLQGSQSGMHQKLDNSLSIRSGDGGRALETLPRDGSTRKEKEWKRTLACKLYEERMTFKLCEERTVVEGAEEMDLLWEAYESDADKPNKFKNKGKNVKKQAHVEDQEQDDGDDDDDENDSVRQLCCLQALSFSTGKLNLGVRRHNLARISKAFKGIGLFRRSTSAQSGRG